MTDTRNLSPQGEARMMRLADYPGEGSPPPGADCDLLCEDHVGTYALPYACAWTEGTWRNLATGQPVMAGVVAWRVRSIARRR
jgi:hypothetical protein